MGLFGTSKGLFKVTKGGGGLYGGPPLDEEEMRRKMMLLQAAGIPVGATDLGPMANAAGGPERAAMAFDDKPQLALPRQSFVTGDSNGKERRGGNIFDRLGRGIGRAARNGDLALVLAGMQANMAGNHGAAATINARLAQNRQSRAENRQEAQQRQTAIEGLINGAKQSTTANQLDPMVIPTIMANPQAFSQEMATRFRSSDLSEGESRYNPGLGHGDRPSTWTAPKTYEQGSDIVRLDPNNEQVQRFPGMTAAEQEARAIGLQPGTPGFDRFIRDRTLGGQGPTAVEMNDADNATSRRNVDVRERGAQGRHSNPRTSSPQSEGAIYADIINRWRQGGQVNPREREFVRSYETRNRSGGGRQSGSGRSGGAGRGNGAVIVNPQTGQRMRLEGGRWVPVR